MALDTIINTELGQSVLIFLLIFTLVFAVLQKTKILGEGKSQIDALIALSIGLMIVTVGYATDLIKQMIPFLGVSLVVILVFLLLVGIFFEPGKFKISGGLITAFGILAFIAVVIAVISFTGSWEVIQGYLTGDKGGKVFSNVVLLIVVGAAIWIVIKFAGNSPH